MMKFNNITSTMPAAMLLVATLGAAGNAAADGVEKVGDFALIDHQGGFMHLSEQGHKKALVIFSQANSCAATESGIDKLRKLREQSPAEDVAFYMMNSVAGEDRASLIATAEAQSLDFPILDDSTQLVAEKLGISKAGQVVVLDPSNMAVAYRGPVDAQLDATLDKVLDGKLESTTEIAAGSGCDISFPALAEHQKAVPDYATEVAPIVEKNCAYCHREGGIGPFAMNNHMMMQGFAPMIREVLLTKRMPPMQVDPHFNYFNNANYMSDEDLQTLVHWIDAGAPRGDSKADPLTEIPEIDLRAWQEGEPDYIVRAPKQDVPATGVLDYINIVVPLDLEKDRWVKAVQFIPGDPTVLHHLLTYVVPPTEDFTPGQEVDGDIGEAPPPSQQQRQNGNGNVAGGLNSRKFLEGYAPGKVEAMDYPENTGIFIPKGHHLAMQFHYTTSGKATSDETLLGLYFYDEDELPEHEYHNTAVASMFNIPPNSVEHKVEAEHVFENDIVVYGLRPHMHYRGKYMKFTAELPDGSEKVLMNVPDYSYAWQPTFEMDEPVSLPAGTKVKVTGAFDNSKYNPANPDPDKALTFGLQTWDEMFIGYFSYYIEGEEKPDLEGSR